MGTIGGTDVREWSGAENTAKTSRKNKEAAGKAQLQLPMCLN